MARATKLGVPARKLDDEEVRRELLHLYETRRETFLGGSRQALATHTDRMIELEHEFAARFPDEIGPEPRRTRRGARREAGQSAGGKSRKAAKRGVSRRASGEAVRTARRRSGRRSIGRTRPPSD